MAFCYDPEFATVLAPLAEVMTARPAAAGDWQTLREGGNAGLALLAAGGPDAPGVDRTDVQIPGYQGAPIGVRLYRKAGSHPGSGIVYTTAAAWSWQHGAV